MGEISSRVHVRSVEIPRTPFRRKESRQPSLMSWQIAAILAAQVSEREADTLLAINALTKDRPGPTLQDLWVEMNMNLPSSSRITKSVLTQRLCRLIRIRAIKLKEKRYQLAPPDRWRVSWDQSPLLRVKPPEMYPKFDPPPPVEVDEDEILLEDVV